VQLVGMDRRVTPGQIKEIIVGHSETDVRRALLATRRAQPDDVVSYFEAALGVAVPRQTVRQEVRSATRLKPVEDPYAS
jgi:hypothetical protein